MKITKTIFFVFFTICIFLIQNSLIAQDIDKAYEYYNNKQYEKAITEFENVLPVIEKEYGKNDTTIYTGLLLYAAICYDRTFNFNKAEPYYFKCKSIYKNLGDTLNFVYTISINNLAMLYRKIGNYKKAEPLLNEAMNIVKVTLGEKHSLYALSLNNLASLYSDIGNYKKVEPLYIEAMNIQKEALGQKHPDYALSLNNLATLYGEMDNFKKAEPLYIESINIRKETLGEKHPDYALSLNNLASLYSDMGNYEKAEPLVMEAMNIRKEVFSEKHPEYARSLNSLALLNEKIGNYEKAESLHLEAINILKEALGEKHPDYALSLNNLASLYSNMGNYKKAEPLYIEAIDIWKEVLGEKHPDYALSLNNLASLYSDMGNYKKAEPLYIEAMNIQKEALGQKHLEYARSLNNLATLYCAMGNYKNAEHLYIEVMNTRKKALGEKHPDYALSINNLASLYSDMGNYEKAEPLVIEAMNIRKEVFGEKHPYYARSLNNLALLYKDLGDYEKVEPLYIKAINIRKETLGEKHPDYATSLNNLALLYSDMGNYKKAKPLYIGAMNIWKGELGEKHPDYATSLNNLASLYSNMGNYKKAEPLYIEAMNIRKEILGEKHPDYALSLNNLATIYSDMGYYKKAEPLHIETMNILKEVLGEKHPNYALSLNNLAALYHNMGNYKKAESLYIEAMNIRKIALGEKHSKYTLSLNHLALLYIDMSNYERVEPLIIEASDNLNFQIEQSSKFMSEKEREIFLNTQINYYFDIYNSFFLKRKNSNPRLAGIGYNNAFKHKGLLLQSSIAMRQTILNSGDKDLIDIYERYIAVGRQLEQLYSQPVSERKFNTDSLEASVNVLEKELTNYINLPGFSNVTYKDIQKSLRKDEAAIEFIRFQYFDKEWTDSVLYCALVLRKDYKYPEMIYLFKERELEKLLYKDANTNEYNYIKYLYEPGLQKGDSLYLLTWQPLDKYLKDIKTVYISPSGLLNRIAFDAVPYDNQHILSDKYKIVYTSSTAKITEKKKLYAKDIDKTVLFGGIEYEADISQMQQEAAKYKTKNEISQIVANRGDYLSHINKSTRDMVWMYLSGSQTEVEKIGNILSDNNKKYDLFTGISGTEEAFKNMSNHSPSVLHISTHGFYFDDNERLNKISQMGINKLQYIHSKNPLMRSGVLFAGAQNAFSSKEIPFGLEDGVLTAYEVSHLNLLNTDLVVLSACQTGLGDVKGSEGVYGLQRSFKMAGVDYLLISLWQVPDYQTRELMVNFYNNWFSGLEIRDAFKNAQNQLKNKYSGEPGSAFNWAAFVLIN